MSQRPAWSAGMRPSNAVLTMFWFRPSFVATAWYDSTSKPIGFFGSAGAKNSMGEYSMSTQFDSSPGLISERPVVAAGALVAGAPVPVHPTMTPTQQISANARLTVVLTTILLHGPTRLRLPSRGMSALGRAGHIA